MIRRDEQKTRFGSTNKTVMLKHIRQNEIAEEFSNINRELIVQCLQKNKITFIIIGPSTSIR